MHLRVDVVNAPAKLHPRVRGARDRHRAAHADAGEIAFVEIGDHPDGREVRHGEQRGRQIDVQAGVRIALCDDAADWRLHIEGRDHVGGGGDPLRALFRNAEQHESRTRRLHARIHLRLFGFELLELLSARRADRIEALRAGLLLIVGQVIGACRDEGGLCVRELGTVDRREHVIRHHALTKLGADLRDASGDE